MARPPLSPLTPLEEARQQVLLDRRSTKAATPESVSCTQTSKERDMSQKNKIKRMCLDVKVHLSSSNVFSYLNTSSIMFYLSLIWWCPC